MKPNEIIPLFDKEEALERLAGDKELLSEIISVFCEHVPSQFSDLEASLNEFEKEPLARAFHSIRGASANIGASRLSEYSKSLEEKSERGSSISKDEILKFSELLNETLLIIKDWSSE